MSDKKSVPAGVKVISVLYYIAMVFGVIVGLLWLISSRSIGSNTMQVPILGAIGSSFLIIGGILFIGLGIFSFFIARGLWKAKPWARIVVIIFTALAMLMSSISMIQGSIASNIPNLVIQLVIGGYLLFNNSVKQAFA